MCDRVTWFDLLDGLQDWAWNTETSEWDGRPSYVGGKLLDFIRAYLNEETK